MDFHVNGRLRSFCPKEEVNNRRRVTTARCYYYQQLTKRRKEMEHFEVTKKFTTGLLAGFLIKEITTVPYVEGSSYKSYTGSDYEVVKVIPFCRITYTN